MRECEALPHDQRALAAPVCDKNCFECPYDDCILDELDAADYKELSMIDREILNPKNAAQRKVAAQKKAYREAKKQKAKGGETHA